ncbi:MAG: restriction endonuclease [bacterium]|nr:restriction endonuclease [bacterium]
MKHVFGQLPELIMVEDKPDGESWVARFFVGRDQELSSLEKAFAEGKRAVQVCGEPGMGKSSLVFMFAERNANGFPGGVFVAHAHDPEGVEHLVQRTIPSPPRQRALLVIDEADALDDEGFRHLRELLQMMPQLRLIVTARRAIADLGKDSAVLSLGPLTNEGVTELLEKRIAGVPRENAQRIYELLQGNRAFTDMAGVSLRQGIVTWDGLLTKLRDFQYDGILGPDGRPLGRDSKERARIVVDVSETNAELLRVVRNNPSLMRSLSPRKFEEIVAELLGKQGYEVTLTPFSKDGGFDMYAAKKDGLGKFLYLVECKQYTPPQKVGVGVARSLYGVIQAKKATAGVIVTTSFFTKGAKDFQRENFYQLQLRDYIGIQDWLMKYVR